MKPKDSQNPKSELTTIGGWLLSARSKLKKIPDEPVSSLHALLAFVSGKPAHFGISHPDFLLSTDQRSQLDELFSRLLDGVPLPYLTSNQEFYGLEFFITPDVLIPRPETEGLVEAAIQWLQTYPDRNAVLDVGTGSGCIPVSICANVQNVNFVALDRSFDALRVAAINVKKHQLIDHIHLVQMDLTSAINRRFDCICANLPYIPFDRLPQLSVSRYEPIQALDGGEQGLEVIARFLRQADEILQPRGVLFLEIDYLQFDAISHLVAKQIPDTFVKIEKDLAGLPRIVMIEKQV